MENKIQLLHPAGKKAVRMQLEKYEIIKNGILEHLNTSDGATHSALLQALLETLAKKGTKFKGSIEWHMEWVKLDLEARKKIIRSTHKKNDIYTIGSID
jgi:hypothetical protein